MGASNVSGPLTSDNGFVGDLTGDVTGTVTGLKLDVITTLVADGAVPLTVDTVYLNGSAASVAATLADGTEGQTINAKATDVSNAVTLVPANFADGTTITFTPANEYIILKFDGTNWNVFGGDAAIT